MCGGECNMKSIASGSSAYDNGQSSDNVLVNLYIYN